MTDLMHSLGDRGPADVVALQAERELERLKARPDLRPLDDIPLVGTPDQVTEVLLHIIGRGAHQLTVNFADVPRAEGTALFAAAVLPRLRAA